MGIPCSRGHVANTNLTVTCWMDTAFKRKTLGKVTSKVIRIHAYGFDYIQNAATNFAILMRNGA